jgi:hypothetical protein
LTPIRRSRAAEGLFSGYCVWWQAADPGSDVSTRSPRRLRSHNEQHETYDERRLTIGTRDATIEMAQEAYEIPFPA